MGIARALALNPKVVVLDEPLSALDMSIQSQVLNLLVELQERLNLSYVFISHDLSIVEYLCDSVAVMYLGRIVEQRAGRAELFASPRHPVHAGLAGLGAQSRCRAASVRAGRSKATCRAWCNAPAGCAFHTRCPLARAALPRQRAPNCA